MNLPAFPARHHHDDRELGDRDDGACHICGDAPAVVVVGGDDCIPACGDCADEAAVRDDEPDDSPTDEEVDAYFAARGDS